MNNEKQPSNRQSSEPFGRKPSQRPMMPGFMAPSENPFVENSQQQGVSKKYPREAASTQPSTSNGSFAEATTTEGNKRMRTSSPSTLSQMPPEVVDINVVDAEIRRSQSIIHEQLHVMDFQHRKVRLSLIQTKEKLCMDENIIATLRGECARQNACTVTLKESVALQKTAIQQMEEEMQKLQMEKDTMQTELEGQISTIKAELNEVKEERDRERQSQKEIFLYMATMAEKSKRT